MPYSKSYRINYYDNYKYQRDAIAKGLDILKDHNGVLIADVVGLGKSIIASAIANNLGLRTIVICPPHFKEQWKDYLYKFKVKGARIYTSGKILDALSEYTPGQKLIIVDELLLIIIFSESGCTSKPMMLGSLQEKKHMIRKIK